MSAAKRSAAGQDDSVRLADEKPCDPVEGGVRERQRVLQVGLDQQNPGGAGCHGGHGRGQRLLGREDNDVADAIADRIRDLARALAALRD